MLARSSMPQEKAALCQLDRRRPPRLFWLALIAESLCSRRRGDGLRCDLAFMLRDNL
jgi:hypothetical protein